MKNIYSNFDHTLDTEVEKELRENPDEKAEHTAWDFHGTVWFDGALWHEEVWRYCVPVAYYTASSVSGVIEQANKNWGNQCHPTTKRQIIEALKNSC